MGREFAWALSVDCDADISKAYSMIEKHKKTVGSTYELEVLYVTREMHNGKWIYFLCVGSDGDHYGTTTMFLIDNHTGMVSQYRESTIDDYVWRKTEQDSVPKIKWE